MVKGLPRCSNGQLICPDGWCCDEHEAINVARFGWCDWWMSASNTRCKRPAVRPASNSTSRVPIWRCEEHAVKAETFGVVPPSKIDGCNRG